MATLAVPATGSTSVSGTAVQVTTSHTSAQYGISIKAAAGNGGKVYVGFSNAVTANTSASTDGYELAAGDSVFIPVGVSADISTIYVIASTSSQTVFWVVM